MDLDASLIAMVRLAVISIGGLSIYLGYRLFLAVRATGEGEAQVKLPGDVTVMLSRVGPGVFFALFGALVVGASMAFPLQFTRSIERDNERLVSGASGMGDQPHLGATGHQSEAANSDEARRETRKQVRFLNGLPALLPATLADDQKQRVQWGIRDAKLQLMKPVWGDDWGQYTDFVAWAEDGPAPADPNKFKLARQFFETGKEETP